MRAASVGRVFALALAALITAGGARAQTAAARFTPDPRTSLAWWQVNPHLSHLWATTCPGDPSWRPGDGGRSLTWASQFLTMKSKTGYANVKDTIIPLYPRKRVRPLCEEAVSGEILVADTTSLRGVHGIISVTADKLTTGMGMRDNYARNSILQTATHPTIKFTIDSVSQLTKAHGDTLRGNAYGVFSLHGVDRPMSATLKTWHEAGGLRVQAKFMVKASDLIDVYRMSKYSLGLGVGNSIWEELHMGVDVVLRPAAGT